MTRWRVARIVARAIPFLFALGLLAFLIYYLATTSFHSQTGWATPAMMALLATYCAIGVFWAVIVVPKRPACWEDFTGEDFAREAQALRLARLLIRQSHSRNVQVPVSNLSTVRVIYPGRFRIAKGFLDFAVYGTAWPTTVSFTVELTDEPTTAHPENQVFTIYYFGGSTHGTGILSEDRLDAVDFAWIIQLLSGAIVKH